MKCPLSKFFFVAEFEDAVRYIFVPELERLINLKCSRPVKKLRWRVYIHKYQTLDAFCKKLLDGIQDKSQVAVCFGDASFRHNSKGHPTSPRRLWVKKRLERIHGIACIDIWEFNTSQVCSKCLAPWKLEACTTAENDHYVRRCNSCSTLWNRDVNAAPNMVFLGRLKQLGIARPDLFSKSLPKQQRLSTPTAPVPAEGNDAEYGGPLSAVV